MTKNLEQTVLEKIKKENIKPEPKWKFLLKNCSLWFFAGVSLIFGSMIFSVVLYMTLNDWSALRHLGGGKFKFIMMGLPYFWTILLSIFIAVVHYNFRNTKKGYKYRLPIIIIVSVVASVLLGGVLYKAGMGKGLDDFTAKRAAFYRKIVNKRIDLWHRPEEGFLAGVIISDIEENNFQLEDFKGDAWGVIMEDAVIMPEIEIRRNERIKMIGKFLGDYNFEARRIMPMGPGRDWFRNNPEARRFFKERKPPFSR